MAVNDLTETEIKAIKLQEKSHQGISHRKKIMERVSPEMALLRNKFKNVCQKASSRKFQSEDKALYGKLFGFLKDLVYYRFRGYPSPNTQPKQEAVVENFAKALYWLQYLDMANDIPTYLSKYGITCDMKQLSDVFELPKIDQPEISSELRGIIAGGVELQREMCELADKVKIEIFDELDGEIRFSKFNKNGIKRSAFNKLVSTKTRQSIRAENSKDIEKLEKENIENAITSGTLIKDVIALGVDFELIHKYESTSK